MLAFASVFIAAGLLPATSRTDAGRISAGQPSTAALSRYSGLPLIFEQNVGQIRGPARFFARRPGYTVLLSPGELGVQTDGKWESRTSRPNSDPRGQDSQPVDRLVRIRLEGPDSARAPTGTRRLPARINYFVGSDPRGWLTDVPAYSEVTYAGVYRGVDLIVRGQSGSIEFDFAVSPNANPKTIRLAVDGADSVAIDGRGDLDVASANSIVKLKKPFVYQLAGGQKKAVAAAYVLSKHQLRRGARSWGVGLKLAAYDRSRTLIVDPELVYSTYFGTDTFQAGTVGKSIASGPGGTIYIAGATGIGLPITQNAFQTSVEAPNGVVFMSIINPVLSGSDQLLYSTYLGGTGIPWTKGRRLGEFLGGMAVNSKGVAYLTGLAYSKDFPVTAGAFQTKNLVGPKATGPPVYAKPRTSFVTVLDPSKQRDAQLVYSTYLGGSGGDEQGLGVAIDSKGFACITGSTGSKDFPVTSNALQKQNESFPGGIDSAFVSVLNPAAKGRASLVYSTYLGGHALASPGQSFYNLGDAIAAGPGDLIYVTGATGSLDFPVTISAVQRRAVIIPSDPISLDNAFFTVIDRKRTLPSAQLIYSTFLGGPNDAYGNAITVDPQGDAYIVGGLYGSGVNKNPELGYPTTPNAYIPKYNAGGGASVPMLTVINPHASGRASLLYSTYLFGGAATGVALDSNGLVYVGGYSGAAGWLGVYNAPTSEPGENFWYRTLISHPGPTDVAGVALDTNGELLATGVAGGNFATTSNAFQPTHPAGGNSAFITVFQPSLGTGLPPPGAGAPSAPAATSSSTATAKSRPARAP